MPGRGGQFGKDIRIFVIVKWCLRRADKYASAGLQLPRLRFVLCPPITNVEIYEVFRSLLGMHGLSR